ncbi:MAG: tRNA(Ile)-lysidine synthase [Bacteroidota bacterium]
MIQYFRKKIIDNQLFTHSDKLLIAVSGGVDSMTLAWLLHHLGYQIALAHVNYQRRGDASDADETLVRAWAMENKIPFFVENFTKNLSSKNTNFQALAREFRYDWFEKLLETHHFDYILTAHHANDNAETALLNLTRGAGLAGFSGIKPKQGRRVRPLLWATKKLILEFAMLQKIPFRNDASNFTDDYDRNFLRNQIIPNFENLNPKFVETLNQNLLHISDYQQFINQFFDDLREKEIHQQPDNSFLIERKTIENATNPTLFLFELLKNFGATNQTIAQIWKAMNQITKSGKRFETYSNSIFLERDFLKIEKKFSENNILPPFGGAGGGYTGGGAFLEKKSFENENIIIFENLKLEIVENVEIEFDIKFVYFDFDKIKFPLEISNFQLGDTFQPLGMNGKSKKLSEWFRQSKFSSKEKKEIKILKEKESSQILWLIGHRADERFKITSATKRILKVEILN